MDPTVWEAIFFLLALKIPLVFVGYIVWRAIRAVPDPDPPTTSVPVTDTPPDAPPWTTPRRGGPGGGERHPDRRARTRRHAARAGSPK